MLVFLESLLPPPGKPLSTSFVSVSMSDIEVLASLCVCVSLTSLQPLSTSFVSVIMSDIEVLASLCVCLLDLSSRQEQASAYTPCMQCTYTHVSIYIITHMFGTLLPLLVCCVHMYMDTVGRCVHSPSNH